MKITLIGTLPPLKGISPYCLELGNSLSKKIDVEFIGFKKIYPEFLYPGGTKAEDEAYKGSEISKIMNILTYYNPFSWLWAGMKATGEVIHIQWWAHVLAPIYFVFLSIYKIRGKKIVITVHNVLPHENNRFNKLLNGLILGFGNLFIVHTENNKKSLSQIFGTDPEKISVIPHGILEPVHIRGITKRDAREYLKIPYDRKVILHFGNIRDYKGVDVLIKSLKTVTQNFDEVLLLIAGKPWKDSNKLEHLIKENSLENHVITHLNFIPPCDVEYYFSAADLVVLPYKFFDSQSGVGALTISFKRPMLVTDVGGLADFVKDERAIAKPNNEEDLAKKLISILRNKHLLNKLSADSEEIANDYDWSGIADKTIELYKGLL